ncbi:MAG: flagellar biosynthetic protein FliQ [Planctomycetota bacterium]
MGTEWAIELGQQTVWIALLLSAPILLAGLAIGLVCGLAQALTQVHDPSLSLAPRILGVGVVVLVGLPWLIERLLEFSRDILSQSPLLAGGG